MTDLVPLVKIVMVNYNNSQDTLCALRSLSELRYDNYHVVVVDNCSVNNELEKLRGIDPTDYTMPVDVIFNNKNLGFAAGCNLGIDHPIAGKYDYLWVINNDIELDKDALSSLVKSAMSERGKCVFTSVVLDFVDRDVVQSMGGYLNYWVCTSKHINAGLSYSQLMSQQFDDVPLSYIVGASVFYARGAAAEIGPWDETFFLYCEDSEWSLRAIKNGYKLRLVKDSKIFHKDGSSIQTDRSVNTARNEFHDQNYLRSTYILSSRLGFPFNLTARSSFVLRAFSRILKGQFSQAIFCLKLLVGFYR